MITINEFSLNSSFTIMFIDYTLETGDTTDSLRLYVGDRYLTDEYIDLTSLAVGEHVQIALDITDPLIAPFYSKDVFDGIFTISILSQTESAEGYLLNAFYSSICFANSVIEHNTRDDWNELNMLYMLLQAAITYIAIPQIEQALGAYSKVEAICNAKPIEYYKSEISECGSGLGCWIVNGLYIVKR